MRRLHTAYGFALLACLFSAATLSQAPQGRSTEESSPPAGEPSEVERLFRRGVEALRENDLTTARDALERAVAADSGAARAHFQLAQVLALQGHLREAMTSLGNCLELSPEYADAHSLKSIVLAQLQQLDAAADAASRAVAIDPSRSRYRYLLGVILRGMGRYVKAVQAFSGAERLEPDNALFAFEAGVTYLIQE